MQRHLRKQSKVILVTKDKGKCVFPARRTMPRKEASANPGCPMVYHNVYLCRTWEYRVLRFFISYY